MKTRESRNYVLFLIVLLGLSVAFVIYSFPLGIMTERGAVGSGLFPVGVGALLVVLISGVLLKTVFGKTDDPPMTAEDEEIQVAAAVLGLDEDIAAERAATADGPDGVPAGGDSQGLSDDNGDPRDAMHAIPQGDAGGAVQVLLGIASIAFFIIVWEFVDTVVATVLYVGLATFILGGRKRWWKYTLLGLLFPVFAYLLFTQALGVRLP